jgi:CheY-like chemotaxis protein
MEKLEERPLVVVIENERRLAEALRFLIEDWGYLCVAAPSSKALARALGTDILNVKALIVDFFLDDGFTGDKAVTTLMAAIGSKVPAIITTAHMALADRQAGYPVLPKPFDPDVLRVWLNDNVGRNAAGRSA